MFYPALEQKPDNQLLVRVGFFTFVLHFLAIYLIEIEQPDRLPASLSVILKKALLLSEEVAVENIPIPLIRVEEVLESNRVVARLLERAFVEEETEVASLSSAKVESKAISRTSESRPLQYHRFSEILREQASKQKISLKTFSTADFPSSSAKPSYFREEAIQTLISAPRRVVSRDVHGYRTILTDDGFGNKRCIQERGFVGDANPPLWYIIPVKTCGHLK